MNEHDIKIFRDKNQVIVRIQTDVQSGNGGHFHLDFKHDDGCEFDAELLTRYLRKRHQDKIEAIRKAEFFSGWKHAKAKKHGKKWFSWFKCGMKRGASYE